MNEFFNRFFFASQVHARFEVKEHTGTTVVAMIVRFRNWSVKRQAELIEAAEENAKAATVFGFSQVLYQATNSQITLNSFNMKPKVSNQFHRPPALTPYFAALPVHSGSNKGIFAYMEVEDNSDDTDDGPATKKARVDDTI
ncbi:hypothetical protein C5167_030617 [Papaver somniferum]|uniref:uncharacterized protein LOC113334743 n=1 Tax=Papaver somniferum TaxID=3469 RepID=UPI000E705EF3|nr:uncharacterized protein LOC113334743 [Papaver somniferum]RZC88923.1 hypothetical protein C5167_030617 [Papaver somniferum]